MPKRETAPVGAPCWIDLVTPDTESSRSFYSELFGWKANEPSEQFGGYFQFDKDDLPIAGGVPPMGDDGGPLGWSIYLATTDARKTVDDAVAGGGKVIAPVMEVADLGSMAIVSDPGGARIGIWQPNTFQGFGVLGETGAPVWFELHTRDYVPVLDFYRNVFGWETHVMSDTPEFRYTTQAGADGDLAGVMDSAGFLSEGDPSYWGVYFGVDNADESSERVVKLGGTVLHPAQDTPYGRLVRVSDVNGATFSLMGPNVEAPNN